MTLWPPDVKSWLIGKVSDIGKDWGQEKGNDRGWDAWMASMSQWTLSLSKLQERVKTGKPGVLQSMGSQRVRHNLVTEQQHTCVCVCVCVCVLVFEGIFAGARFNTGFTCTSGLPILAALLCFFLKDLPQPNVLYLFICWLCFLSTIGHTYFYTREYHHPSFLGQHNMQGVNSSEQLSLPEMEFGRHQSGLLIW